MMPMREDNALLAGLNIPQRQAVTTTKGPVLVLAGPGSGKTRVITHRMAYLAQYKHVLPWQILAVTFTNKAAREMSERLEQLVGMSEAKAMMVGTFHAVCARVLRLEAHALKCEGLTRSFIILDRDGQMALIKQAMKELHLNETQYRPSEIQTLISKVKNGFYLSADLAKSPPGQAYARYQQLLRQKNSVDFDDLLVLTEQLWREDPNMLRRYQQHWRYLHVDEFQDCNLLQYRLIRLLASGTDSHYDGMKHICVVGDDDQMIYSWRGASAQTLLRFEHDFPDTRIIVLEQNYRSTQIILDAAQSLVKHNRERKQKRLWTALGHGDQIICYQAKDEVDEGHFVASEIARLLRTGYIKGYGDVAVLSRTKAQACALVEPFRHAHLPAKVLSSQVFTEHKETKDILAPLRWLLNPKDDLSLLRMLHASNHHLGSQTVTALQQWADERGQSFSEAILLLDQHPTLGAVAKKAIRAFGQWMHELLQARDRGTLLDLFDQVVESRGYGSQLGRPSSEGQDLWSQLQDLRRLAANAAQMETQAALAWFLDKVTLIDGANSTLAGRNGTILPQSKEDAVTLITLHASKGSEYPVVFIVGLEEGSLPHAHALEKPELLEEERRLAYVGVTRAMRRLYLVYATRRCFYGESQDREPSRFLANIPADLLVAHQITTSTEQASTSEEGRLWLPDAVSDRSTWGDEQADLGLQASLLATFCERDELADSSRQDGTWPLTAQACSSASSSAQRSAFKAGMKVRHARFGEGLLLTNEVVGGTTFMEVQFRASVGKKRLSLDFDRLERV